MNRAEMIEKAARASHQWGLDFGGEYAKWDALRESTRREYREEAAAVLDVLLPQVTTVEELGSLPNSNTWLASNGVHPCKAPHRASFWRGYNFDAFGPLTVVWQP